MKISLIGPGILPIPPNGWGGVESCIWTYAQALKELGVEVSISNSRDLDSVIDGVNNWNPDFVHLHYDEYADILPRFNAKLKAQTSHYPYLDYPEKRQSYEWIFRKFINNDCKIFSLSNKNTEEFIKFGAKKENVWTWIAGVNSRNFFFNETPKLKNKAICLGKIESRKKQYVYQDIKSIDFVGPISDHNFHKGENYLGSWSREQVYSNLTEYGCLVLISDGEAAPAVTLEALSAGCGLVISEEANANLDTSLPFISVVSSNASREEVESEVDRITTISNSMRQDIRNYALENFSLNICAKNYIKFIENNL